MAIQETKPTLEREYTIPLRKAFLKVPRYERTRVAIKTIKRFIAKHMRIPDRDIQKVKLDIFLNNEIWFRGRKNPPAKIKVKAIKENEIIKVDFVEMPQSIKFLKRKIEKRHLKAKKPEKKPEEEKPEEQPLTPKIEQKPEEKTPEQKKEEKEKAQAVAQQHEKQAEQAAKAQKHITKTKEPRIKRMALKK